MTKHWQPEWLQKFARELFAEGMLMANLKEVKMPDSKMDRGIRMKLNLSELEEFFLSERRPICTVYHSYSSAQKLCERYGAELYAKAVKKSYQE